MGLPTTTLVPVVQVAPPSRLYSVLATPEPPALSSAAKVMVRAVRYQTVAEAPLAVVVGAVLSTSSIVSLSSRTLPATSRY